MATKYSDLELAINTLVTEFQKAANDAPTMSTTQFQTMVSKQMPAIAKQLIHQGAVMGQVPAISKQDEQKVESEEGLGQLLQQMGVESGQNISFDNVWRLINQQAIQLFGTMHKEKNVKCNCVLQ